MVAYGFCGVGPIGMVLPSCNSTGAELYTLLEIEVNDNDFPTMEEVLFLGGRSVWLFGRSTFFDYVLHAFFHIQEISKGFEYL